jgi:hypothetical protein
LSAETGATLQRPPRRRRRSRAAAAAAAAAAAVVVFSSFSLSCRSLLNTYFYHHLLFCCSARMVVDFEEGIVVKLREQHAFADVFYFFSDKEDQKNDADQRELVLTLGKEFKVASNVCSLLAVTHCIFFCI